MSEAILGGLNGLVYRHPQTAQRSCLQQAGQDIKPPPIIRQNFAGKHPIQYDAGFVDSDAAWSAFPA